MPQVFSKRYRQHAFGFVVLAGLLLLLPARVAAIPISEYQQNIKNAITTLETVYEVEEDESDYASSLKQAIDSVRSSLPKQQTVEFQLDVYRVNNSWVHDYLDDVQKSDDKPEVLRQLIERLTALEQHVAARQQPGIPVDSKTQAKGKLETILARPEYATGARGPNALTRLMQDFLRWLQRLFPKRKPLEPGRAASISTVVQIVVVVVAFLVLAYVAWILITKFKRSKKQKAPKERQARIVLGERLEPEETATDLLSEAEALARRGELRAAIRKGYIALLVELGDRKLISLAQHKTNRDYLRGLSNVPQLHSRMSGLTDSFERHWYGFDEATESDWQDFRAGYLATLQTAK